MIKRMVDMISSLFGLVLLSWLILLIYCTLYCYSGHPVFFRQIRPGKDGKPFVLVKFRTMSNSLNKEGKLEQDSLRITPLGRFLRSFSLDELPSLWNVLKGDMSLVGPRPLLMEYLPLYTDYQYQRHQAKPGITGWAQINGRNAIDWDRKFELDIWYVEHQSFYLDMKILLLTIKKVFLRENINFKHDVSMPRFQGSQK